MDNWAQKALNRFATRIAPARLTIEVTSNCNYNCIHCYHSSHNNDNELTIDEILDVVEQFKKMGLFHVTITGGEPFVKRDLLILIEELARRHLKIELYTNASLLNERLIKLLKKSYIEGIQISIYGATEATYNAITNTTGNFNRFIDALNLLAENKINTRASIILLKNNYHELDKMIKLCTDRNFEIQYGLQMLNDRANKSMKNIEISTDQKLAFIRKTMLNGVTQMPVDCRDRTNDYICTAGVKGYNLTSTGDITPCTGYYRLLGNVRKHSVYDILHSKEAIDVRNTKIKDIKKCSNCTLLKFCSICPGYIFSESHTVRDFIKSSLCAETETIANAFNE